MTKRKELVKPGDTGPPMRFGNHLSENSITKLFMDGRRGFKKDLRLYVDTLVDEAGGRKRLTPRQERLIADIEELHKYFLLLGHTLGSCEADRFIDCKGDIPPAYRDYLRTQKRRDEMVREFLLLIPQEKPTNALEDF